MTIRVTIKDALLSQPVDILTKKISMYLCGHTAYKPPHLGNLRSVIIFDVLSRLLRATNREVLYIRNTTDIDDKIIQEAKIHNISIAEVVQRASQAHVHAEQALGCNPPDLNPHATSYVPQMLEIIAELLKQNAAYESSGHVLFIAPKIASFYPTEFLQSDDIDVSYKRNPNDFVLWKPARPNEPSWDSPYGPGRPGWHTECVAMILASCTDLTIHGGGCDLRFPHHANELLQLQHFHCIPEIWMHIGMLIDANGKKMSKSLNNTIDALELMQVIPPVIIRIAMLSTHYRHSLPFTTDKLKQAESIWFKILNLLHNKIVPSSLLPESITLALSNDLNTADCFSALMTELSDAMILSSARLLGLLDAAPTPLGFSSEHISEEVAEYKDAHRKKDYVLSDQLRHNLEQIGVYVRSDYSWYCGLPRNFTLEETIAQLQ